MRRGTNPKGASPARRDSERLSAGPSEDRNSRQREDHSTISVGASWVWTVSSSWSVSVSYGSYCAAEVLSRASQLGRSLAPPEERLRSG
jgi:hypothetical protein